MKILVLMKQVPDTATTIRLNPDAKAIQTDGIKWVINPYDEFAIEECLRIKEKYGGEVVVVSLGPDRTQEAIRQALAMGCDRAIHVVGEVQDSHGAAVALAQVCQEEGFDLILTGKQAVDDDMAQVGSLVAAALGLPQVTVVIELSVDIENHRLRAERELEGATEVVELPWPAVVTAQRGLNEPRYPTLPNIMKAKKKEIKSRPLDSLSVDVAPWVEVEEFTLPPERPAARVLTGEPQDTARELARLLHEEAKVI